VSIDSAIAIGINCLQLQMALMRAQHLGSHFQWGYCTLGCKTEHNFLFYIKTHVYWAYHLTKRLWIKFDLTTKQLAEQASYSVPFRGADIQLTSTVVIIGNCCPSQPVGYCLKPSLLGVIANRLVPQDVVIAIGCIGTLLAGAKANFVFCFHMKLKILTHTSQQNSLRKKLISGS